MSDTPLDAPAPNRRKIFFVVAVALVTLLIVLVAIAFSRAGRPATADGFRPQSREVVIWTVNMPQSLFETLSAGFNKYIGRSDMKLVVRDFGSYQDYIDILPRAIVQQKSPDIIMVPNHGGETLFDPYMVSLGEDLIDLRKFEDDFPSLFVDELIFEEKTKVDGTNKIVRGIRGIPVGYEPLGIYYNRNLLSSVPTLWETLPLLLTDDARAKNIPALSLGYGRATPESADIIALLGMQYSGESLNSYTSVDSVAVRAIVDRYLAYRRAPNNLSQFDADFANTLTATDLFVRGKVATLVGYPSTLRDIQLAIKRAKNDSALDPTFSKDLRWSALPQVTPDEKKQFNIARYSYFALAKHGPNRNDESTDSDPAIRFLQYLTTPEAQTLAFQGTEYLLPAQKNLLKLQSQTIIDSKTGVGMTVGDWFVSNQKFPTYHQGVPHLFGRIFERALDEPGATASIITSNIASYLTCQIDHLRDPDTYDNACGCRTDVAKNNNNYWPMCGGLE